MEPGKFRHRVSIEAPSESQQAGGKLVTTWATVSGLESVPAEILPDRAGEFFGSAQLQATTNALIRIRWSRLVTTEMRLRHAVRPNLVEYWSIEGMIDLQGRNQELRLFCLKRDAEGWRRGDDLVNS